MNKRKKFSKSLFQENDAKARTTLISYLENNGYEARENPDKYGPDLIVRGPVEEYYIECEIKHTWKTEIFPWDTIQLPERKGSYPYSYNMAYFIFSGDLSQALSFRGEIIKELLPVEIKNKYVSEGEYFYQIPIEKCKLHQIGEDTFEADCNK